MNKDFYISLIAKKLSNELNAAELKDLSTWLSGDKANSLSLNQFKQTWDLTKDYKSSFSFDAGTAFQSFASKYEIPTTTSKTNIEPKSKVGVKRYVLIFALMMLTSAFVGSLIFNNYFKNSNSNSVANNEMHAQTFALNDAVNVTVAPNSRFEKGVYTIQRKDNNPGNKGNSTYDPNRQSNIVGTTNIATSENKGSSNYNDDTINNRSSNNSGSSAYITKGGANTNGASNANSASGAANNNNNNDYAVENFYGQGYFDVNVPSGMKAAKIEIEDDRYVETENATFNLQNYEQDDFSVIDVQTGSVKFVAGENILNVSEGQRLIYNEKTGNYKTVKLPELNPFQWHKGILKFDNTPLAEAFNMIERFYGVNIEVNDVSTLENHNVTATHYKSSNLNECLELLSETIDMKIERVNERDIQVSNIKRK